MDPVRSSRLALDAAVVVAIDAVVVVIIASVRLLSTSFAVAASLVAIGVAAMVISRLRHVRGSLATRSVALPAYDGSDSRSSLRATLETWRANESVE